MKQIKLIFLMVLLAIPFTRARALAVEYSDNNLTMTVTIGDNLNDNNGQGDWIGGGSLYAIYNADWASAYGGTVAEDRLR